MIKRVTVILSNLGNPNSPEAVQPLELDIKYKNGKSILEYNLVAAVGTMSEFVSVMAQLVCGFLSKIMNICSSSKLVNRVFLIGYSVNPIKLLQGN